MRREQAASVLGKTALFGNLSHEELLALAEHVTERVFKRGQIIVHEGDEGSSLFVVAEGLIKVYVTSEEGDEMVLVTLRPPDVFGEVAILDSGPRSASAEALERSTVLTLGRRALLEHFRSSPELAESVLKSLGGLVRRLTEQTADLVFLDLHGRVAKLLVGLATERGEERDGAMTLDLSMTQSDLASMVGGSRQSVNQILQGFARRGYVELSGRTIVVKEPDALKRRAGL